MYHKRKVQSMLIQYNIVIYECVVNVTRPALTNIMLYVYICLAQGNINWNIRQSAAHRDSRDDSSRVLDTCIKYMHLTSSLVLLTKRKKRN